MVRLSEGQAVQQEESKRLMKSLGKRSANQPLFLYIARRMSFLQPNLFPETGWRTLVLRARNSLENHVSPAHQLCPPRR